MKHRRSGCTWGPTPPPHTALADSQCTFASSRSPPNWPSTRGACFSVYSSVPAFSQLSFTFGPNKAYVLRAGEYFAYSDPQHGPPQDVQRYLLQPDEPNRADLVWDIGLPMEEGRYMMRWRTHEGRGLFEKDEMGPAYARLLQFMKSVGGCTTYTTFGPNQSYFSTSDNGVSWQNLPPMLEDTIMNNLKVKTPAMVALGAEGTFVMVYNTGEYTWNLPAAGSDEASGEKQMPAYAGLEKLLTPAGNSEARKRGGVKYAALSPYNTTEYFVLFGDNTTHWDLPAEWHDDVRGCLKHWTATLDAPSQAAQAAVTKKEHSHGDWSELIEGFNKGVEFTTNIVQLVQAAQGNS